VECLRLLHPHGASILVVVIIIIPQLRQNVRQLVHLIIPIIIPLVVLGVVKVHPSVMIPPVQEHRIMFYPLPTIRAHKL
jgi:hypothetical protein